jgi:hypothetical protein
MLPNAARAFIDPVKVRNYLLSPAHPIGRFKAAVFRALGYSQEDWERLRDDLIVLGRTGQVQAAGGSDFGVKYLVSGSLTGPNGRTGRFVSVWLVESGESAPRLITAYPE